MGLFDAFKQGFNSVYKVTPEKSPEPVVRKPIMESEPIKPVQEAPIAQEKIASKFSHMEALSFEQDERERLHRRRRVERGVLNLGDEDIAWAKEEDKRIADGFYANRDAKCSREELYHLKRAQLDFQTNDHFGRQPELEAEFPDVIAAIIERNRKDAGPQERWPISEPLITEEEYYEIYGAEIDRLIRRHQIKRPRGGVITPEDHEWAAEEDARIASGYYTDRDAKVSRGELFIIRGAQAAWKYSRYRRADLIRDFPEFFEEVI